MSIKDDQAVLSTNEKQFISQAIKAGMRTDGRKLMEMRKVRINFHRMENECSAEVQLGRTRVITVVNAEIIPPYPDRPTDGFLQFTVDLSPMASASFESGRPSPLSIEISRIIERGFRDSRALDTEALCLIAGEKVWAIKCSIHVLDDGGNIIDAAALATSAALLHFRKPEVSISNGKVIVHPISEQEPVPLSLHHIPLCISFAILQNDEENLPESGSYLILDPSDREELVINGRLSLTLNKQEEVCAIHHLSATPVGFSVISRCLRTAAAKVTELSEVLTKREAEADVKEREKRRSKLRGREATYSTLQKIASKEDEGESTMQPDFEEAVDYKNISTTIATRTLETEASKGMDLKTIPMLKAAADATELAAKHAAKTKDLQKSAGSAEEHFLDKKSPQQSKPAVRASSPETDATKASRKEETRKKKVAKALSPVESDSEEETTIVLNAADSVGDEKKASKNPKTLVKPEKTATAVKAQAETKASKKTAVAAAVESDDDDDLLSAVKKSVKTKKKKSSVSKKLTS